MKSLQAALSNWEEVGECHEWRGLFDGSRPVLKWRDQDGTSRTIGVRRELWLRAGRKLPSGWVVVAKCLNPACVRIEHGRAGKSGLQQKLRAGTPHMQRSAASRARLTIARRKRPGTTCTMEKARAARALKHDGIPVDEIAQMLELSVPVVKDVLSGRTWRETVVPSSVFNFHG